MKMSYQILKSAKEIEFKYSQCKTKVVDIVKCYKCFDIFHPKWMEWASNAKLTICKHEEGSIHKLAEEIYELRNDKNFRNIELQYLKELLRKVQEKNRILMDNNSLLMEKISLQGDNTGKNTCYLW